MNRIKDLGLRFAVRATLVLLLVAFAISLSSAGAQSSRGSAQASIASADYSIQGDVVILSVKVDYSFGSMQTLKVTVDTYNPQQHYERIFSVGPGTGLQKVDLELKPIPHENSWLITICLYNSNQKGGNVDLLQEKNIDIDIKGAEEQQNQPGLGTYVLILGVVVLAGAFHFGRRNKKARPNARTKRLAT